MTRPGRLVLLGHPVAHSLSPRIHEAALAAAGIALRYEALDVEPGDLPRLLSSLSAVNAAGNVTVPHKAAVSAQCATVTPLARRVGAVNTFRTVGGALDGDNTDVAGFDAAVRGAFGTPPAGMHVAVLGAGGGAAAVLTAVEQWPGATAVITSRDAVKASLLAERFSAFARAAHGIHEAVPGAGMVVNATPVGLAGDAVPCDPGLLTPGTLVFDLAYARGGTQWVRSARSRGLAAEDGLAMLVEQGALSFERWFGFAPDREAMWRAVR